MFRVFRLLWSSLGDYYYEILPFTGVNLLWIICLLGLPSLGFSFVRAFPVPVALLVFVLSLVCVAPAIAALFHAARMFADGYNIGPRDFFVGFRRYFWRSWQLLLADIVVGGLLIVNIWFYATRFPSPFKVLAVLWLYVIVFWLMMQPYLFALLTYQDDKRLRVTARNAVLLTVANLGHSFATLILGLIFLVLSVGLGLPALALTGIVGALWCTRLLDMLMAKYPGRRREEVDAPTTPSAQAPAPRPIGGYGHRVEGRTSSSRDRR